MIQRFSYNAEMFFFFADIGELLCCNIVRKGIGRLFQ